MKPLTDPHPSSPRSLDIGDPRAAWQLWLTLDTLCARLWDTYYEQFLDYCENDTAPTPPSPPETDVP